MTRRPLRDDDDGYRDAYPQPSSLRRHDPNSPESIELRRLAELNPPKPPRPYPSQDELDALPF